MTSWYILCSFGTYNFPALVSRKRKIWQPGTRPHSARRNSELESIFFECWTAQTLRLSFCKDEFIFGALVSRRNSNPRPSHRVQKTKRELKSGFLITKAMHHPSEAVRKFWILDICNSCTFESFTLVIIGIGWIWNNPVRLNFWVNSESLTAVNWQLINC
jgi:hypothetical protein